MQQTLVSAFCILTVNSWLQTLQDFTLADGRFFPASWWSIILNPSFPCRLVQRMLAAYLSVAFIVGAVGAWHRLRNSRNEPARLMASLAPRMACIVAPIRIVAGDALGVNTLKHQPREDRRARRRLALPP